MVLAPTPQSHDRPTTLTDIWAINAKRYGNALALWAPHSTPEEKYTYSQLHNAICQFASALQAMAVQPGDHIAIIADNSPRWFIADQGSLMAGTVNIPRSAAAPTAELDYILEHSGSTVAILEDLATLDRLQPSLQRLNITRVLLLSDEIRDGATSYSAILQQGQAHPFTPVSIQRDQLATLIYTSGTTGRPKGVMLSHANLMHQVEAIPLALNPAAGERFLSILPTWHSYERSGEYFLLSQGCEMIYSTRRHIKQDLNTYQPHYMVAVPRIWETVYEGAQRQFREKSAFLQTVIAFCFRVSGTWVTLGRQLQGRSVLTDSLAPLDTLLATLKRAVCYPIHLLGNALVYRKVRTAVGPNFQFAISGGGALAAHLETFYEIVGINILVGYGLTETSPVLTVRRIQRNVRGTSGVPLQDTEIQVVDSDTYQPLPQQDRMSAARKTQGIVRARGPQIMQGYYANPDATAKVLSPDGWFDTGDIGWLTPEGELVLTGRAKDTIVLSNGENIEPQPLEDVCTQSPWIDQMVVVGQDQKRLGALVYPNGAALLADVDQLGLAPHLCDRARQLTNSTLPTDWSNQAEVMRLVAEDLTIRKRLLEALQQRLRQRKGYRPDEAVGDLRFVPVPFTMDNGLMTQTYKIRRNKVAEQYSNLLNEMYRHP